MVAEFAAPVAGATALIFAGLMLFQRSLYAAAVCLLVTLFQTAVFFYLSGAFLIAFMQVMVIAGAVMVLIVVTIMAAPAPGRRFWKPFPAPRPLALAAFALLAVELLYILFHGNPASHGRASWDVQAQAGAFLFGPLSLATEAVTILMFLAAMGLVETRRPGVRP